MKTILTLIFIFTFGSLFSQIAGDFLWTKHIGGNDDDYLVGMDSDNEGNIYCTFITDSDQIYFGDSILGQQETFVSKLNNSGEPDWVFPASSSSYVHFREIHVTASNDIFVLGNFKGTTQIGDTTLIDSTGQYHSSHFFMKMDTDGNFDWVRKISISRWPTTFDMAVDDNSNLYFTGYNWDSIMIINSDTIPNYSDKDLFVLKYNQNGELLWGTHAGTDQWAFTRGRAIALDNENNIIIGGDYHGSFFIYGNDTIFNPMGYNLIFMKLDNNGELVWVKLPHGDSQTYCYDISCNSGGEVYATGHIQDGFTFDTINILLDYNEQVFIAGITNDGEFKWVKTSETNGGRAKGHSIVCDNEDNILVTGKYNKSVYFDNHLLTTDFYLDYNGYLAKMDTDGNFDWVMDIYNKAYDDDYWNRKTIVDTENNIYTSGVFNEVGVFENDTIESYGLNDIYISRLNEIHTATFSLPETSDIFLYSAYNKINIYNLSSSKQYSVSIFNLSGQKVYESEIRNKKEYSFDFNRSYGLYLINITDGKTSITKKVFCGE